jgi:hypothetical protein
VDKGLCGMIARRLYSQDIRYLDAEALKDGAFRTISTVAVRFSHAFHDMLYFFDKENLRQTLIDAGICL